MTPDGEPGWDGPLDVQIPDDARELERDVLAYRRELRAMRRRKRLRRLLPAQAGIMPLLASVFAVCLVAGMMLSVFSISLPEKASKPKAPATHSVSSHPASQSPSPALGQPGQPRSAAPTPQPTHASSAPATTAGR